MFTKKFDLLVMIVWPLLVFILVFGFDYKISYFDSLILVFVIPSAYLSIKSRKLIKKVSVFSLAASIPIALIFELLGVGEKAWVIPNSIIPWRLFSFSPIENYLWQFLTVYTIIIFYEYFCNKSFQPNISRKIKLMNLILYSLAGLLVVVYLINSELLNIKYSYIWPGIILFIIPSLLFLIKKRYFLKSFLKVQLFFLYSHLIFELIGVKLGHWLYTSSNYIGLVKILGQVIPVEELFFVMIIGALAACAYYEFFTYERNS